MFKKQNSLIKKKFNFTHNLHPIFYKNNLKKRIDNKTNSNLQNQTVLFKNLNKIKFLNKNNTTSLNHNFLNLLNGKKKLKKSILTNRKLYNFLNLNIFKTSKALSKNIVLKSKLKLLQNLISLEFSLLNIILNTNIIKSHKDLITIIQNNGIFLNRVLLKKINLVLNVGDILELCLSFKVYNYIKFFKQTSDKHLAKIRNKIWYKLRLVNKNNLKYNNNTLLSNVFKNNLIFKNSIPNYLEIDYFSLSFIIVFKNINFSNYSLNLKKILIIYLFKLYNWK